MTNATLSRCASRLGLAVAMIAALPLAAATAAPNAEGLSFEHRDWELHCDNTGTCRAAGWSAMDADRPASLLIERAAGPAAPLAMRIALAEPDRDQAPMTPCGPWCMTVRGQPLATVRPDADCATAPLPAAVTATVLDAVRGSTPIRIDDGRGAASLSVAGASAVLLKMDEVQGRIGTPGALVRRWIARTGWLPRAAGAAPTRRQTRTGRCRRPGPVSRAWSPMPPATRPTASSRDASKAAA